MDYNAPGNKKLNARMGQGSTKVLHKNLKDKEEKRVYLLERKLGKVTM